MKVIAVDTETTGLSTYHGDRLFSIAFAFRNDKEEIETAYIEFPVNPKTREVIYDWNSVGIYEECFIDDLASHTVEKVFHHAKFDLKMLKEAGLTINGPIHDTSIAARCVNSLEPSYKLKVLSKKYLKISDQDEKDLKAEVRKCHTLAKNIGISTRKVEEDYFLPGLFYKSDKNKKYNILDTVRTLRLWEFYADGMEQMGVRKDYDIEMELMPILLEMEDKGVRFNYETCLEEIDRHQKILTGVKENLIRELGDINPNSPKQLLPALQRYIPALTSTNADELDFYPEVPAVQYVQEYRGRSKGTQALSSYLESSVPEKNKTANDLAIWKKCRCIHTTFNQGNVRTWRLSSSDENLQQVANPKTSEALVNGRVVFEPRCGFVWYCFDYSGQEARIFGSTHKEQSILDLYANGLDPFEIWQKRIPELAKYDAKIGRKYTKNTFYSKIYGGGVPALMKYLKRNTEYCKTIIAQFDKELPQINKKIKESYNFGLKNGYVKSAYGRRIDINPERAYTTSCNAIVQCSAAELMKKSMIKVKKYLKSTGLDIYLLLSVHDEIIIECRKEHAQKSILLEVKRLMEDHDGAFCLPMPVEIEKTTTTWADKSKEGLEWLYDKKSNDSIGVKEKPRFYFNPVH